MEGIGCAGGRRSLLFDALRPGCRADRRARGAGAAEGAWGAGGMRSLFLGSCVAGVMTAEFAAAAVSSSLEAGGMTPAIGSCCWPFCSKARPTSSCSTISGGRRPAKCPDMVRTSHLWLSLVVHLGHNLQSATGIQTCSQERTSTRIIMAYRTEVVPASQQGKRGLLRSVLVGDGR